MNCPLCTAPTRVLETRNGDHRRRECPACDFRFSTVEIVATRRDVAVARRLAVARVNLIRMGYLRA